jgi:hypothetical protein
VSRKTSVIYDGYRRGNGLTFLVDRCPEKLPNSLFFDRPSPFQGLESGLERNPMMGWAKPRGLPLKG